ncbi:MAG: VCBS repeat-containing protein [Desulfovibrio sp.]|nr:MAG: VCBS repeat-containing protein [Desulfovibrio sp.]
MIVRRLAILCLLMCALITPGKTLAQEAVNFAVLPFTINGPQDYQYLDHGIQDMLVSRLHWQDKVLPLDTGAMNSVLSSQIDSEAAAASTLEALGCDLLVWGSVTILGEECSLDIKIKGVDGAMETQTGQASLTDLIPALERIAVNINNDYFGRTTVAASESSGERVNTLNPALTFNEEDADTEYYLNPQFRYAGDSATEGRIRSRSLPFAAVSAVTGDVDADGRTEVLVMGDHHVTAYRFDSDNQLHEYGTYQTPLNLQCIMINLIDTNRDGYDEIVICAADDDHYPRSFILNYQNDNFIEVASRIRLYLGVVNRPPDFSPSLVGCRRDPDGLFESDVHEIVKMDGEYTLGQGIALPPGSNPFNIAFLPQEEGYKIVLTDKKDHLEVYTYTGDLQYESEDVYSGSSVGLEVSTNFGPFQDDELIARNYYVPKRMIPINFDGDANWELIVNHPVSLASQFFERYRAFPQGEIHCMYWDGVGLTLVWKTRRIKGSVVDYGMDDVNDDGITDLFVAMNTHPGALGVENQRCVLLLYPLDLEATDTSNVDSLFTDENRDELQ